MKYILTVLMIGAAVFWNYAARACEGGSGAFPEDLERNYQKTEMMIPMRDGIALYTSVYSPKDTSEPSPVLLMRTPYSLAPYGPGLSENLSYEWHRYLEKGYIIVFQNVRGTYLSEGDYMNIRPLKSVGNASGTFARRFPSNGAVKAAPVNGAVKAAPAKGACESLTLQGACKPLPAGSAGKPIPLAADEKEMTDDATDTYDTIEWILANTRNNGRVGVKGASYPGFYATVAAMSAHPAIKAVSPQAPIADWFMGDDIHHNGAFFLCDTYRFGAGFFRTRRHPSTKGLSATIKPDKDIYDYFLEKGSISDILAPFGDSLSFLNEIKAHPSYDSFWKERNPLIHKMPIAPAILVVGGFYDAEDCYGTFATYRRIKESSPHTEIFLACGPWAHGAWSDRNYNHLDGAYFGDGLADYFMDNIEYPFFEYYLEGRGAKPSPVLYLPSTACSGGAIGGNQVGAPASGRQKSPEDCDMYISDAGRSESWKESASWPPAGMEMKPYYLSGNYCIDASCPVTDGLCYTYISDPRSPVPYYHGSSESRVRDYMAADQTFLSGRKDVLTFASEVLSDTLSLAGPVNASIYASFSSTDADIIVKVIDERPDGYMMLVRGDVMPVRFRNSFEHPEPVSPGEVVEVHFTMPDIAHDLLPGHRLLLQVQSSWFPLVAMNPQNFLENPYLAVAEDYRTSEITIHCGLRHPSRVDLPVVRD